MEVVGRKLTQLDETLAILRRGSVTTHDFASTHLCCEYRKNLSLLRKRGYVIRASRLTRSCWRYELVAEPPKVERNGQLAFA